MANEYFAAVYLNAKNKPLDFLVAGIADAALCRRQKNSTAEAEKRYGSGRRMCLSCGADSLKLVLF